MFLDLYRKHPSQLLPADYVEFVRWNLKRYISHKYTRGQNTLIVYLMAQDAETLLALPAQLDAGTEAAILQAVRDEVGSLPPTAQEPVILTASTVRRRLQRLVSTEFPRLAVLLTRSSHRT